MVVQVWGFFGFDFFTLARNHRIVFRKGPLRASSYNYLTKMAKNLIRRYPDLEIDGYIGIFFYLFVCFVDFWWWKLCFSSHELAMKSRARELAHDFQQSS